MTKCIPNNDHKNLIFITWMLYEIRVENQLACTQSSESTHTLILHGNFQGLDSVKSCKKIVINDCITVSAILFALA